MSASNVEIANSALSKLGAEQITSLSDNTRRAVAANLQFHKIRKNLLRSHPWNFAMKRQYLTKVKDSSDAVNAGTDVFTSTSLATLNQVTGDKTNITLLTGTLPEPLQENTDYYFIKVNSTTFKLATTQANALAGTAIDVAAATFTADFYVKPPFEYDNKFAKPSDCLRPIREQYKDADWKVEGAYIVSNESEFNLLYIYDVTDPTLFEPAFDELFAMNLAVELSYTLVQSLSLKESLKKEWLLMLKDTRSFDAQEGSPEELETNEWLNARL